MKFNQISGQPRLYVSSPERGIAYVAPAGVSSGPTIEPTDALTSDQLRGSFWFLPDELNPNEAASVLIGSTDALVQTHGGSRLLIWSDRPGALPEELQQSGVVLCMNDEGTAITQGRDVVLAGDALGLSIGTAGDLKFDPDRQVLQIGAPTPLDLKFTGTQAPQGVIGQVTIPWDSAQLGHWQFELTTGSKELFQLLPCGVRYFFAGDKPDSASIELWYPFFAAPAAEAAPLKLAVTVDLHAPIENRRCAFGFKEAPAGLPSYLRTRFGHEIALIPTAGSSLVVTHVDNRTRLEPVGEFKVKVDGAGPVDLLCGLSGTETILLQDGDGLKFEPGNPAFAPGFPLRAVSPVGAPVDPSGDLLAPSQRTAWVSLAMPGRYSAQPEGGWLYGQDDLIHKNDGDLLGAMDVDQPIVPGQPFPLVPYAGVNTEAVSNEILESFERTVLAPARRKRIAGRTDRTLIPGAPSGNEPAKTFNVTTAAGFVAVIGAENQWQSIRLGQSAGKQFGFDHPSVELQAAFQSSELFLVVANAQKLVAGGSEHLPAQFHNAVDFDGWKLTAQVGQNPSYGDYSNVVIVKGRKGKIIDLVANPNAWNDAATFAAPSLRDDGGTVSAPDPSQLVQMSHWLQQYVNDADRSESGELAEFKKLINDENWTGVLVLKATVTPPEELAGLTSGADPQRFYAHHFGIAVTPIDGIEVEQSGDSATFGLVQYCDGACVPFVEPTPVPPDPGATFDFKLLMLRARFENGVVTQFDCCAQLTIDEFFGDRVGHMGETDNPYNAIMLRGSLQKHMGSVNYVLDNIDDNRFYLDSELFNKVEIVRAAFATLSSDTDGTRSRISLEGFLDFKRLGTAAKAGNQTMALPCDIFSFGSPYKDDGTIDDQPRRGLRFSGLTLEVIAWKNPTEGQARQEISCETSGMIFDPRQSAPREKSLSQDLALEIGGLMRGSGETTAETLGYLKVATDLGSTGLGESWYGLRFRLNLGRPGKLAGGVGLNSELLLAWSPGGSAVTQVGLKLPGSSTGAGMLSLQGMLNLTVGSIRLSRIDGAFMLVLDEIAIKFLGLLKFPAHGATSFYLFGNPSGDTRPGKLGWYAVYNQQPPKKLLTRGSKSRARLRTKKRGT